jgi:hypothetical protein
MSFNSVQFGGSDGRSVVNDDISSHLNPVVSMDGHAARGNIQTRTGVLDTWNSAGQHTQAPASTSVQLHQDDGLVRVKGFEVKPEVAERLQKAAPQLFEDPAVAAAEAATAAADEAKADALRESLARHSDDQTEAAHLHFVGDVPTPDAIALLVQMHQTGAPSDSTLHKVGEAMGLTPDQAVTTLNKMAGGVQNQLAALATAHGVDANAFSDWMRTSRREESLKAMTTHVISRDVFGAWNKHLTDFVARTGPKR